MTDHDLGRQLAAALGELDRGSAPAGLRERVAAITSVNPVRAAVSTKTRSGHGSTLLAATAALLVVAASATLIGGGADSIGPSPSTSAAANIAATPTPTPVPTSLWSRVRLVSWPGMESVSGALQPGAYALPKPYGASDYTFVELTLPRDWTFVDGILARRLGLPDQLAIAAGPISAVHVDPCRWRSAAPEPFSHHHGEVDGTFIDTVAQLAQLDPGVQLVEVDMGGAIGHRLQMTIPSTLDISACDNGAYRRWDAGGVDGHPSDGMSLAGATDLAFFVDVDRQALFIRASHGPAATVEDRAELEAILASIVVHR